MSKPYSEMTPAERLADRIAKNREIERRVQENKPTVQPRTRTAAKRKSAGDPLSEFQRIKNESGIDAASEFVRGKLK